MAGNRAAFQMADRLAGGRLIDEIAKYRKVHAPYRSLAEHLHDEYGIVVSADTLRVWAIELGVADGPREEQTA